MMLVATVRAYVMMMFWKTPMSCQLKLRLFVTVTVTVKWLTTATLIFYSQWSVFGAFNHKYIQKLKFCNESEQENG